MAKTAKKKAAPKKKVAAKKAPVKKAAAPKKKSARKPNAAFMRPVTPSDTLAPIVGAKPMPRSLQDKTNRRQINADTNLKAVFGGKSSVNMFAMTKLVSKHLK
jgi:upstream activation factor subunit UAF30